MSNALTRLPPIRLSPDVVTQKVEGGMVLVELGSDRIFELNPTAARLWELLEKDHSPTEVHQQMLTEFEVEAELLEHEILMTIQMLEREGLLSLASSPVQG